MPKRKDSIQLFYFVPLFDVVLILKLDKIIQVFLNWAEDLEKAN